MNWHWLLDPFSILQIPVGDWVQSLLNWLVQNHREFFQLLKQPVQTLLNAFESGLRAIPPLVMLVAVFAAGWQAGGRRVGFTALFCIASIGLIGAWTSAMTTLAIVLTAVSLCVLIGVPLGILASQSERCGRVLRPILDLMQTIPSFVYLVPVVMLFGIGNVPGVIVTVFYAMPPVIRLTALGITQVRADLVEASVAFGASRSQSLFGVQLPLAMPVIMAGVNQTVMMSLAMTVVASMISVTGLGQMVLRGIGRLDMSLATTGGLGIVLMAVMIDRISQGLGRSRRERGGLKWYRTGPIGVLLAWWPDRLEKKRKPSLRKS